MGARDTEETLNWLKKGAERGNVFAQFNLGVAYLKGGKVEKNYVEAYRWLHLSALGGYDAAPELCAALKKKMDSADVSRAKRLADEWKAAFDEAHKRKM
jgi:hypothetical protein